MRAPLALSWLLAALTAVGALAARPGSAHDGEPCARCDPEQILAEVETILDRVSAWQLTTAEPGSPPAEPALLSALESAHAGQGEVAFRLARQAAARCFLRGERFCGEALPLLAERMVAEKPEDPATREEALALLSLVPWEALSSQACEKGMILRYRLAELSGPRVARSSWADGCGAVGRSGELGYRAAKAALLGGTLADAAARLEQVRLRSESHVVRSTYLLAVLRVAEGRLSEAEALFARVLALSPEPLRRQEEDDARVLAALQLARLARERDAPKEALDLYRAVPAGGVGRDEALLEGAVVAAHLGDLGAARLYLDSLLGYRPDAGQRLDVHRLRASLVLLDDDEAIARQTFRELTEIGREVRARYLTPAAPGTPSLEERMRADPSLGGLVDASDTRRLLALEDSLAVMAERIADGRAQIAAVRAALERGEVGGTLDDALLELEGADALLRQLDGRVSGVSSSPRLAGPARAALRTEREAARLRKRLEAVLTEVKRAREDREGLVRARLAEVEAELDEAAGRLDALAGVARGELEGLRAALLASADEVASALEMSEDVGDLEIHWRKKQLATLEVERAVREYDQEKKALNADAAGDDE